MFNKIQIDLFNYGSLQEWSPKIGDVIFKDGFWSRWCAVIDGINGENLNTMKAGNMQLLLTDEHKIEVINIRAIRYARFGKYMVVSNGNYYV